MFRFLRGEGTGFSSEIETCKPLYAHPGRELVARELASHLRLKPGTRTSLLRHGLVARELASHLRLKPRKYICSNHTRSCGEGTGFSSEIETSLIAHRND